MKMWEHREMMEGWSEIEEGAVWEKVSSVSYKKEREGKIGRKIQRRVDVYCRRFTLLRKTITSQAPLSPSNYLEN